MPTFGRLWSGIGFHRQPRSNYRPTSGKRGGQWACGTGPEPWCHSCEVRPIRKHSSHTTEQLCPCTATPPEQSRRGFATYAIWWHVDMVRLKRLPTGLVAPTSSPQLRSPRTGSAMSSSSYPSHCSFFVWFPYDVLFTLDALIDINFRVADFDDFTDTDIRTLRLNERPAEGHKKSLVRFHHHGKRQSTHQRPGRQTHRNFGWLEGRVRLCIPPNSAPRGKTAQRQRKKIQGTPEGTEVEQGWRPTVHLRAQSWS